MRSFLENKRLILLLAMLALLALTVLAISLNGVPFREAQHFGRKDSPQAPVPTPDITEILANVPFWKQLIVWLLVAFMVLLIGLLLSPELRKRLFIIFIRFVATFWAIYFLLKNFGAQLLGFKLPGTDISQPANDATAPVPVFQPPHVSATFSYLISFAFALLWLAIVWGLYRGWKRYLYLNTKKPLDEIAKIARSSLNDLSSGRNSSDVIINCYLRMSDVVSDTRHLQRAAAMTPREFAARLEQAGLPGDAVTRLTRLFEGVRYGDKKSGPRDVNEAVSCLKTILHYCGEPI